MFDEELRHPLLDFLRKENRLKSDSALAVALGVKPPTISKIRRHKQKVSAELKILIYKKTGMSIEDIEAMIGESDDAGGTKV